MNILFENKRNNFCYMIQITYILLNSESLPYITKMMIGLLVWKTYGN